LYKLSRGVVIKNFTEMCKDSQFVMWGRVSGAGHGNRRSFGLHEELYSSKSF
jgi:hypothetical protein